MNLFMLLCLRSEPSRTVFISVSICRQFILQTITPFSTIFLVQSWHGQSLFRKSMPDQPLIFPILWIDLISDPPSLGLCSVSRFFPLIPGVLAAASWQWTKRWTLQPYNPVTSAKHVTKSRFTLLAKIFLTNYNSVLPIVATLFLCRNPENTFAREINPGKTDTQHTSSRPANCRAML